MKQQIPNNILSKTTLYGVMGILMVGGYALLVSGISLIFSDFSPIDSAWVTAIIIFILALVFSPVKNKIESFIDSQLFISRKTLQDRLQLFGSEIANTMNEQNILNVLRQQIDQAFSPGNLHIFVLDPASNLYIPVPDTEGKPTTDLQFPPDSAIVQKLLSEKTAFKLTADTIALDDESSESSRIKLLSSKVFSPLPGGQQLAGWVALGETSSGVDYLSDDLLFLESICQQAGMAIERTRVVTNLENRVHEMNALARISEGVNITLTLDDILELIFTQTTRIIPADDFHIVLIDKEIGALVNIFYVENNERLFNYENHFFSGENTPEYEVIKDQIPIITDDFARECRERGIIETTTHVNAWMCVPLNSGGGTIGALSMGSRSSDIIYTHEQMRLMEAIADQAAGAIVKTRLLEETERRARQFLTLSEVSRQLTATFELETLLKNILDSAVMILNCDAGSLLLADEETGELVFEVVVGPVASELQGTRMPPGKGVVGEAISTREPVIVNNIQSAEGWYSQTDAQTGFITEGLMAIPLQFQDNVFGVIEVLNKKDHTPFNQDDQDLLQAFAAQVAVAIVNARIYTMTDQALTARLEELSIMQQIDRELNASLDSNQPMQTTLRWSLKQSGASAGLVGMVREEGILIMAASGYEKGELDRFEEKLISLNTIHKLDEIIESGEPLSRLVAGEESSSILDDAQCQTIIPIQRENATIGLILLESNQPDMVSEEIMNFLIRLSDHASVAISNAELYKAVQAANVAKSEFVSFVSHELKNPMTSIKGYTELMASGAVGAINEAQQNFLGTIRTNVERMNTLVSDLADVSRIEAGRLRLEFASLSVSDIFEEVIRSRQQQIDEKSQKVKVELPENLPPLWADKVRVVQVMTNLLSNANKYTPEGGEVVIAAEQAANEWDTDGPPQVIHIWVKDNGLGISEEDQAKIFQKFFRSEDSKARESPGTGLGLNITKQLVERQGGKIWFESVFRQGTTFHFTIPIAEGTEH